MCRKSGRHGEVEGGMSVPFLSHALRVCGGCEERVTEGQEEGRVTEGQEEEEKAM